MSTAQYASCTIVPQVCTGQAIIYGCMLLLHLLALLCYAHGVAPTCFLVGVRDLLLVQMSCGRCCQMPLNAGVVMGVVVALCADCINAAST